VSSGVERVVIDLTKPIGSAKARLVVTVSGKLKSTSKLYATKDYKLYKDFKPLSGKVLYVPIVNYFYDTDWNTLKLSNGTTLPGLEVVIVSPKGWDIFYARSSLSSSLRYMELREVRRVGDHSEAVFWYLSKKTILPTKFAAGSVFGVETGFLPRADYHEPGAAAAGAALLALAAVFAWYYRDVWRYVGKSVG